MPIPWISHNCRRDRGGKRIDERLEQKPRSIKARQKDKVLFHNPMIREKSVTFRVFTPGAPGFRFAQVSNMHVSNIVVPPGSASDPLFAAWPSVWRLLPSALPAACG
jgi:hypothetical protein